MSLEFTLRFANPDDAAALGAFSEHVFRETFGSHNTAEDMDSHCRATFSVEHQRAELADRDRQVVLALVRGEIAGFVQLHIGPPPPCVTGPAPLELKRLYVDARWHGTGIAKALMLRAIELAREGGAQTLYLSVWQHNHRAIAFYAKHGFATVGTAVFVLGNDQQMDPIMALPLSGAARAG
jgi:GNAT superfamily N-acetyltransferase